MDGGWYDQHPDFVDKMFYILGAEARYEKEQAAKERAKASRSGSGKNQSRYGRSRRR